MWPEVSKKLVNEEVLAEMISARSMVELGLALRAEAGLKVRQVLSEFTIGMTKIERSNTNSDFSEGTLQMIADELNVKQVTVGDKAPEGAVWKRKESGPAVVALNIELTDELKREGLVREVIRTINNLRKEQKLTIEDRVVVVYDTANAELAELFKTASEEIKKNVLAKELRAEKNSGTELEIDGRQVTITLQK
jgi:isoleucyl-tRNA synthetase